MATAAVDEEQPRSRSEMEERLVKGASTMARTNKRKAALVVAAVLTILAITIAIALAVTRPFSPRRTSQGPNSAFGTVVVDGVGESPWMLLDWTLMHDWDSKSDIFVEGAPQILLFDDLNDGGHGSNTHSSSEVPWAYTTGYATSNGGTIVYEYAANSTQYQNFVSNVSFSIDGLPYDLSQGGLFLIRSADGVSVEQVDADIPDFFKSEDVFAAVQEFAESNDDVVAFLKEVSGNQRS
jgi:hypothetical protein